MSKRTNRLVKELFDNVMGDGSTSYEDMFALLDLCSEINKRIDTVVRKDLFADFFVDSDGKSDKAILKTWDIPEIKSVYHCREKVIDSMLEDAKTYGKRQANEANASLYLVFRTPVVAYKEPTWTLYYTMDEAEADAWRTCNRLEDDEIEYVGDIYQIDPDGKKEDKNNDD